MRGHEGETTVIDLPTTLDYPIVAIGDLHGQRDELERLVGKLEALPEWPDCALVFLGDFVDRNPEVRETIDLVLELLRRPPGGSAVMGNHDLALVRAARLDGGPPSPYWVDHYRTRYDHQETFESYLGTDGDDLGRCLGEGPGRPPGGDARRAPGLPGLACPGWSRPRATCSCTTGCRTSWGRPPRSRSRPCGRGDGTGSC